MVRFVRFWSICLCLAGVLLSFAHNADAQAMRDLIDFNSPPSHRTPRTPESPSIPVTSQNRFLQPGILRNNNTSSFQSFGSQERTSVSDISGISQFEDVIGRPLVTSPALLPLHTPIADYPHLDFSDSDAQRISIRSILGRITSVLEDVTEDEREERELLFLRQRAEHIFDSRRREEEMNRVRVLEADFENRRALRAENEVGADLFYFPRLKEQLLRDGWTQLFDGHTDFGWKIQDTGPYAGGNFFFGQNEIRSDPYQPGLIYTAIPFGDISLRFDYWAEDDAEVFLLLKTPPSPADLNTSCYAFVLNSTHSMRPRGIPLGRHGLSAEELRTLQLQDSRASGGNEWQSVVIKNEGGNIRIWMGSRTPVTYFDPTPIPSGHVAFLVARGEVRFQNILWQPTDAISVFDTARSAVIPWRLSEDADLLRTNIAGHSGDAGFRLSGGSVESKEVFGDFALQMKYKQGKPSGQSSLFIRAVPEQENTGYGISLQNLPKRQDREAAVGVDAGAFRNIKDARYTRPPDMQWTYLTVMAVGNQMQTWVNGVPVCVITDIRSVRENVLSTNRKAPFLSSGTIRLQVPPENTLFEFRNLMVSPILTQPGRR